MHKHPTDGVAGAKPRVPGEVSQAELSALNHEYLEARNRQMASKAAVVEMALAERQGTLISKRMAKLEVSFILNSFRQRVMAEPA